MLNSFDVSVADLANWTHGPMFKLLSEMRRQWVDENNYQEKGARCGAVHICNIGGLGEIRISLRFPIVTAPEESKIENPVPEQLDLYGIINK